MPLPLRPAQPIAAIVAKTDARDVERYLVLTPAGQPAWVDDPLAATAFDSMREATRAAMRLPSSLRAFGLPRAPEQIGQTLH